MSTLQVKRMKAHKKCDISSKTQVGSSQTFLKALFSPVFLLHLLLSVFLAGGLTPYLLLYQFWGIIPESFYPFIPFLNPWDCADNFSPGCLYILFQYFRPWCCPVVQIILLLPKHPCFPAFLLICGTCKPIMCISSIILPVTPDSLFSGNL